MLLAEEQGEKIYTNIECTTTIKKAGNLQFVVKYKNDIIFCKNQCQFTVIPSSMSFLNTLTYYTNKNVYLTVKGPNEIEIGTQKFIQQRNIEKEAIVQNLTGMSYNQYCNQGRGNQGNNYNNFGNTNDFLDPNQNLYTNLNVTKNINYGNNNNRMNYMNNQNNQNYFNPNMYQQNNNNMSNMNNNHPFRSPGFNDNQSGYPQNNNNNNFGLP